MAHSECICNDTPSSNHLTSAMVPNWSEYNEHRNSHVKSLDENMFNTSRVSKIDLSGNEITELPPKVFGRLRFLLDLHLEDNRITMIPAKLFRNQSFITYIYLQRNLICYIDKDVFTNIRYLTTLDLSMNKIKEIHPYMFRKNMCLRNLFLNDNEIMFIGEDFLAQTYHMETLSLANNYILHFNLTSLAELDFLKTLDLRNSQYFTCAFDIDQLNETLAVEPEEMHLEQERAIECSTPQEMLEEIASLKSRLLEYCKGYSHKGNVTDSMTFEDSKEDEEWERWVI